MRITSGTALAMRAGASRDVMEVHRMLAHPSEDITRKTAEIMGIETTGHDRRTGEHKRTAILRRRGRADEALESRREQLRRHFRGRLHPLQGGKVRKEEE